MELEQLRAFVAAVDDGSLLAAAERTGLSRSTLRQRLRGLEEELGETLLVSSHRGVVPTKAGEALLPGARRLIRDAGSLALQWREELASGNEVLHIQAPMGLPPELVQFFLSEMLRRFPGVSFKLSLCASSLQDIPDDAHLVIHFGPAPPRGCFRTFVLSRFPEQLLASKEYLAEFGRPDTIEDLHAHRLLSWIPPGEDGRSWPTLSGERVDVSPCFVSADIHLVRTLVAHGQGIALLPDSPVAIGVPGEDLEPVLPDQVGRECILRVLVPEALAHGRGTRTAIEILREMSVGTPWEDLALSP